jgi:hypothetical protein
VKEMSDELLQQILNELKAINVKHDKMLLVSKELLNKIEGKL